MRCLRPALVLLSLLLAITPVLAAGTVTVAHTAAGSVTRYAIDWTSDASGDVNGTTMAITRGFLIKVEIVPDAGGTQPTNLYDVKLQDENDVDLLSGNGQEQSNADADAIVFRAPIYHDADDDLELIVQNAGNAKGGTVYLWVQ